MLEGTHEEVGALVGDGGFQGVGALVELVVHVEEGQGAQFREMAEHGKDQVDQGIHGLELHRRGLVQQQVVFVPVEGAGIVDGLVVEGDV